MHTFSWIVVLLLSSPGLLSAAVFGGGGLQEGIDQAKNIQGVSEMELSDLIVNAITVVINILGLLAAVSIIICGILLIVSLGDETMKEKAKKGIMYSAIGLLIILSAKAIVTFITEIDTGEVEEEEEEDAEVEVF